MPRFQISLRKLFVVMTVVAVAIPVTRNIIREREEERLKQEYARTKEAMQEHRVRVDAIHAGRQDK